MQYLGSRPKRKVAALSAGMATGVFAFHVVPTESVSEALEILPEAAVAAATIFAGTFVGVLVWSAVGAWLKKRREPGSLVCIGVGICLALALLGVYAMAIHNFLDSVFAGISIAPPVPPSPTFDQGSLTTPSGAPSEVLSRWLHDIGFWLAISLWISIGYGLAVSPAVRTQSTSDFEEPT